MIGRCALLAGEPAVAATVALASAPSAAGQHPSPISDLFRQWEALYRHTVGLSCSDDEMDGYVDQMSDLAHQIVARPCRDVHDLAAKIVVETNYRSFDLSDCNDTGTAILAEAEALAGALLASVEGAPK